MSARLSLLSRDGACRCIQKFVSLLPRSYLNNEGTSFVHFIRNLISSMIRCYSHNMTAIGIAGAATGAGEQDRKIDF